MKIYTEINYIWSEEEGKLIETSSKSFDYEGPMSLCHERKFYGANIPHSHKNYYESIFGAKEEEGPSESEQAAAASADLKIKRDKAVADLETDLGGFDDDYFKNIGRKYSNFAMNAPVSGIRDQRSTAMDELIAQLSRQGMLNSTVRTDREALAKKLFGKAQVDARREGTRIGRGVEKEFQGQKTLALQDIASATDPASSANASMGSIMSSTKPGTFDPMLDVFLKLTQGLAMRQEVERRKDRQAQLDTFYGTDSAKYHS